MTIVLHVKDIKLFYCLKKKKKKDCVENLSITQTTRIFLRGYTQISYRQRYCFISPGVLKARERSIFPNTHKIEKETIVC